MSLHAEEEEEDDAGGKEKDDAVTELPPGVVMVSLVTGTM